MQELIHKLRFKEQAVILNAPAQLDSLWADIEYTQTFDQKKQSSNTLAFINNKNELLDFLTRQLQNIQHDSMLWIAYPKGSSKIKTDINRDTLRATAETFNLQTVTAIAVNDTWTALRLRPVDKVGK